MEAHRVLVLSQGMEPVTVVSWQRALTLFFSGKVEILSEYDGFVRSTSIVIKIPAVVRLVNFFKRSRKPVKFSRINVHGRDDYRCQYCGIKKTTNELTYDHVIPKAQGGKTSWQNICSCCHSCNTKKGCRTPAQAGMKLRKQPIQPSATPTLILEVSRESVPDAWRDFLYWTSELLP
jgi:5-methylcytosine-specific restriction endonuclease McrA